MLLQLMVYAKIIYLLMVVISGALCTVEDYVIMSQCAHNKAIYLAAEGTVSVTDISQTQNITIVGRPDFVNNNFKIALYAKETQRYLCFNDHWKLVGMKELQDTCYFNEAIVHGYFVFRSVVDMQRRIGFTQRGRAVGPKKTVNDACYMFTKIPTDQFFHQHTHFSAPKTKSTTTKIPKTEYTHTPYTTQAGRGSGGSGGGRTKTNRFKNPQRQEDAVAHNHSGHGHGSGSGSGGGSGSGNGSKKFKKQRNGNKQRQQKQKQEMQQQIRGHSYNLSNPKNSTYLNSSRQNLVLSQHSINNHTNKKHNNNNSNSNNNNNNNHPPQNHQVRHHHNDPNKVARRQQHDQKQKTKLRQRVRPSPSASAAVTPAVAAATTTTTATATTTLTTAKLINSSKPHHTLSSSYSDIHPTSVIPTISTDATSDIHNTMSSTLVVAKRKGRRRKGDKLHKKGLQKKLEQERQHSREQTEKDQAYSSSVGPAYDEEEEFITSSTDYAWMTNDITMSAVKPTSASLPSWDTWYPSSSTAYTEDEDADYSLGASATASSATETNADTRFSTTLETSSSMTDLDKNTLSSQTSVPLPTSVFTTTLTENSIDETISPTVTTDLGTTTTNTSTYTQTDFWSTSLNDNTDADILATGFTSETFNTYATPQLENTQNTLNTDEAILEHSNTLSTQHSKDDSENSTAAITLSTIEDDNDEKHEVSSPPTERTGDEVSDDTTWLDGSTSEMTSSGNYEKADVAATTTTTTYTNDCAYSTASTHNGSKTMTDCMFATKTTAPIANNHKQGETTPLQYTTQSNHDKVPKMDAGNKVTASTALNSIIPIRSDKTTSLPETTSRTTQSHSQSQSSTQFANTPAPATPLQPVEKSIHKEKTEINTAATTSTATAFSSTAHATKSPVPLALTTRKTLRKSTQKLLATPFHQLTYVRNEAGDIDIDSIDNISIYPELLDNDNDEPPVKPSTSRLTMISGYLPTSATATLPESIRIAKIKINRERKRMLRLRNVGNYA